MSSDYGEPRLVGARPVAVYDREPIEWVIPGLVPQGKLTVLAGAPKSSKSMLTLLWAAELSKLGKTTMLLSAEDDVPDTIRPRLEACGADLEKIWIVDPVELPEPEDVSGFRILVAERDPTLIVLDPVSAYISAEYSSNSDHGVRKALDPLRLIAQVARCSVVWIQHLNKRGDVGPMDRIGGSVAFGALPRSVLLFGRKPETEEDSEWESKRVLIHFACNVGPERPPQEYRIEQIILEATRTQPMVETARLRFTGGSLLSAEQLLARQVGKEEQSERQRAMKLVQDTLCHGGKVATTDLEQQADAEGISRRTMMRVRSELGVKAFQEGRRWYVRLAVTSQGASGQGANPPWHSDDPGSHAGLGGASGGQGATPTSGSLTGEDVSQSPDVDSLGTASLDDLRKMFPDTP